MIIVVPGTWWRSRPDWAATYRLDQKPMLEAASLFGGDPIVFEWSGANCPQVRHAAAVELAALLRRSSRQSPIHLLGFSHGGNIASEAIALLDSPGAARTLVTVSTPISGRYRLGGADLHVNLYSDGDLIQRSGGEWLRVPRLGWVGLAKSRYPVHTGVRNIQIDGSASRGLIGRHGDTLWRDETWLRLKEIIHPQCIP